MTIIIIEYLNLKTNLNLFLKVWDHSWKYTLEDKPCMKIWFKGPNPNKATAEWYALNQSHGRYINSLCILFVLITISFKFL